MPDPLSNYLMNGDRHASLSAESLELMGKQAANRFLQEGLALNESICKLAGEHQDINGEQIRRIVEYANSAVYLAKHDQSKTAGADSSYPQFDLADAGRIIQEMSDGARPTVTTQVDVEYSRLPAKARVSAKEDVIAKVFGIDPEKIASVDFSKETAVKQVMDAKSDLVAAKDLLEHNGERFDMALKEAQAEYYDLVKRHMLDGHSFRDVLAAAQSSGADKMKIAEAFRPIIERLLAEKVASPAMLRQMTDQLEKVAHRVVNEKHPLVSTFCSVLALEAEVEKVAMSLAEVDSQLGRVRGFIKEQFLVGQAR